MSMNQASGRLFDARTDRQAPEPKFGSGDYEAVVARIHFERLVSALLRALAFGSDPEHLVTVQIREFAQCAVRMRVPMFQMVEESLQALHQTMNPGANRRDDILDVVLAGLLVAAESVADDLGAPARASKRESDLIRAIERYVVQRERRSREGGWSHLNKLLHDCLLAPPQK